MRKVWIVVLCSFTSACGLMAQRQPIVDANGVYSEMGPIKPQLVHAAPAAYAADPKAAPTGHTCVFDVVVGTDGSVQSARLENAHSSAFDAGALEAVKASTFSPAQLDGQAVPVHAQVAVIFRGDGQPALPEMERGPTFKFPKATYWPAAQFSDEARKKRVNGVVLLSLIVTEDGTTDDVEVLEKLGHGLDEEAVKAVREWRFKPAQLDGNPVPTRLTTEVSFRTR